MIRTVDPLGEAVLYYYVWILYRHRLLYNIVNIYIEISTLKRQMYDKNSKILQKSFTLVA